MFRSPFLQTTRLVFKPFPTNDVLESRGPNAVDALQFLPVEPAPPGQIVNWFEWRVQAAPPPEPRPGIKACFTVIRKADGVTLGWCGLGPLELEPSQTEVYYAFLEEHWGQGYATETLRALLEHGFGALGLTRIIALVQPSNPAAIRVMEKAGLQFRFILHDMTLECRCYEGELVYALGREA